jgi:hypothetical protein
MAATLLGRGATAGGDPMAQEIHLGHGEGALLEFDDKTGRLQPPENLLHVLLMLLHGGAGYDDIVKIDESER